MVYAVLAYGRAHDALREFFPDAVMFRPGEGRTGARFDRVLVFFKPSTQFEEDWILEIGQSLPKGQSPEYMV